ncbi:ABC transporter permease subunit [Roseomonas sp. NAR14]|uniref:ABC transporter permease subunit n=1 Tax=Roseomonas acroporae TaxID=2937791 RepID=A0A9X2BTS0_9PROT|nr:ABC transporter permease subunit [Roseomonas acroporae]MCK8784617.1 ABC transporter permease subunit [Roseomonas acroporae]
MSTLAALPGWVLDHHAAVLLALGEHVQLSLAALLAGGGAAVLLGLLGAGRPRLAEATITLAGVLRTLPSLAVLAALLPLLGVGFAPSFVALSILAVPPVLVGLVTGLRLADPAALDAAAGMGMTRTQRLFRVSLPLAAPLLLEGFRTASVQVVSGAALASFIGGGGLGDLVTAGVALLDLPRLLTGAIAIALLALLADLGLGLLARRVAP